LFFNANQGMPVFVLVGQWMLCLFLLFSVSSEFRNLGLALVTSCHKIPDHNFLQS